MRTGAGSFPELGDAAWGARGRWLVVALQWSGYYLGAVAQIAYMGASWDQTFRGQAWAAGVCQSQWMGVTALCLWPFMMVPSFTASGYREPVASKCRSAAPLPPLPS